MKKINVPGHLNLIELVLPDFLAPYLLYGEMPEDDKESEELSLLIEKLGLDNCTALDCSDEGFLWRHDASFAGVGGANCFRFSIPVRRI